MVQLASVTTKFYVSIQPTLRTRVLSKYLSQTSNLKKSTTGPTIQKGVLHFLQKAGHVIDKGLISMFMGISQMVLACLHQRPWNY